MPEPEPVDSGQFQPLPVMTSQPFPVQGNGLLSTMRGQPADMSGLLGAMLQGFTAPARAARGEPVTYGDTFATAMDYGLLGAPMAAPAGALRAGGMRTQADEVAEMLRTGRAADVTDDMMAAVDPQEMYRLYESGATGMDMPMDEASRMARAENIGFSQTPLYRGETNPDLQQFMTGRLARDGIGVTTSKSPNVAATYMAGDSPSMYPLVSRSQNPLDIDVDGRNWTGIPADARANRATLSQILEPEAYLDEDNLFDFVNNVSADWGDGTVQPLAISDTNSVSRAAQAQGYDEVRFNNVVDRGGSGQFHTGLANDPQTTVMTALPRNIRSQFARFDPRLSHLANLSAGIGGAAMIPTSEAELEELRRYLGYQP
jgi:hypothetical protein